MIGAPSFVLVADFSSFTASVGPAATGADELDVLDDEVDEDDEAAAELLAAPAVVALGESLLHAPNTTTMPSTASADRFFMDSPTNGGARRIAESQEAGAGRLVVAATTPRPMSTSPLHCRRGPRRRARSRSFPAIVPDTSAYVESLMIPNAMNTAPSTSTCTATGPCPSAMNCGKNATKNSAVLGLRTFTTKPWP